MPASYSAKPELRLSTVSPGIAHELASRQPGGYAIVADFHPLACFLGGSTVFRDRDGAFGNVKSYAHSVSAYIAAFRSANLEIEECVEPRLTETEVAGELMYRMAPQAYLRGAVGMPFGLIWLLRAQTGAAAVGYWTTTKPRCKSGR